jgi:tRNA threonylcarbamoyladenosine biosynthesis protein TsaB
MRILAVDTASMSASVAALERGRLRAELMLSTGQTHTRHLMEMIDQALVLSSWALETVDGFAVTIGPGSFTGLRIGISTVKGLGMATQKPVAGVSSLEALAFQCAVGNLPVCALIDGRKGEVYCARYRQDEGTLVAEGGEAVLPPEDVAGAIDQPVIFTGNGALLYRDLLKNRLGGRALFAPPGSDLIRASTVARLALQRLTHRDCCQPENLAPRYIRRPDAEIKLEKRISS